MNTECDAKVAPSETTDLPQKTEKPAFSDPLIYKMDDCD